MRKVGLLLVALLAGCAAQAATGPARAPVNVRALVPLHPLYGTLSQYDRQIAQLRAVLHPADFAGRNAAFAHAEQGVRQSLRGAESAARSIAAMPAPGLSTITAAGSIHAPTENAVRADVQRTYQAQAARARAATASALSHYRDSLLAQERTDIANYERGVHERVRQAYGARAAELREEESRLALDLAKADASKRLQLRAKLQMLVLDRSARNRLQSQLQALQSREDAALAARRKHDAAVLAAFLPPLQTRANADIANMRSQIAARTAANLAQRTQVLDAQSAAQMPLVLPSPVPPASAEATLQQSLQALRQARPADAAAYARASEVLQRDMHAVHVSDISSTADAQAEISVLRSARAQLYRAIVQQITLDAQRLAQAHPGMDVTPLVRADLLALRH